MLAKKSKEKDVGEMFLHLNDESVFDFFYLKFLKCISSQLRHPYKKRTHMFSIRYVNSFQNQI